MAVFFLIYTAGSVMYSGFFSLRVFTNLFIDNAFVGVIAAGTLMVFTQFMTLGLLMLATGGGALAGYLARMKQDHLGGNERVVKVVSETPKAQNKLKGPAAD